MMVRWLRKREAAQSLVEFSLMLPGFLILVFGVIDFGMGLRAYITTAQATREGARYGSVGNSGVTSGAILCNSGSTNSIVIKVCNTMGGLDKSRASVTVSYPNGQTPGNSVRVLTSYNYKYITPLSGLISIFSAGSIGSSLALSSTTDMRLE